MEYLIGNANQPDDYYVLIIRNYIDSVLANQIFQYYKTNIDFHKSIVKVRGKEHYTPRLMTLIGDEDVDSWSFSGYARGLGKWDPFSKSLRDQVVRETRVYFDSAAINYYRDGKDYIGYHSDREVDINGKIVGISFGSSRRFYLKEKDTGQVVKTQLNPGDAIIISGRVNNEWKHTVPKQAGVGERISITFRNLTSKHVPYQGHLDNKE